MAAFRAMIARWLRGGNDDLVKGLAGSTGDAVRLGEEELDGAGGVVGFVRAHRNRAGRSTRRSARQA